jgi:uncharacterized protein (DUF2132 family)
MLPARTFGKRITYLGMRTTQSNNALHGITLEIIVITLHERYVEKVEIRLPMITMRSDTFAIGVFGSVDFARV